MSAAREAFVHNDAQTIREALDLLFDLAKPGDTETMRQAVDAREALDRLEELAT